MLNSRRHTHAGVLETTDALHRTSSLVECCWSHTTVISQWSATMSSGHMTFALVLDDIGERLKARPCDVIDPMTEDKVQNPGDRNGETQKQPGQWTKVIGGRLRIPGSECKGERCCQESIRGLSEENSSGIVVVDSRKKDLHIEQEGASDLLRTKVKSSAVARHP